MTIDDGYGLNVGLSLNNQIVLGYKAEPGKPNVAAVVLGEWREAVKVAIAIYHASTHLARDEGLGDEEIETLFTAISDQIDAEMHDR